MITNGSYVRVRPMELKKYCSVLLTDMEQDIWVPNKLIADQVAVIWIGGMFEKLVGELDAHIANGIPVVGIGLH